jgi:hypothetical protein
MIRFRARDRPNGDDQQRGAAAVEFALIVPLLVSMLLGVIDFGIAFGQNISLQGAAREGARQGVTHGDVIASTSHAKGLLDDSKLQVTFAVDSSAGAPGILVVCLRYPRSSASGFYSWALDGAFEAKAVMRMESTVALTSGAKNWDGGSCTL